MENRLVAPLSSRFRDSDRSSLACRRGGDGALPLIKRRANVALIQYEIHIAIVKNIHHGGIHEIIEASPIPDLYFSYCHSSLQLIEIVQTNHSDQRI
jgi:hypothetical protein